MLNYNPFNSNKKPEEENYDNRKQLKFLKKLALEIPSNKTQEKKYDNLKNFGLFSNDKNLGESDDKKLFPRK